MRLIAILLGLLLLAAPVSAQGPTLDPADFPQAAVQSSPDNTFGQFQIELNRWDAWYAEWAEEAASATSAEEQRLYWADLLARSLEHIHIISSIVWSDCYRPYAESHQRKMLWVTGYIAGVYLHQTAPFGVEPILDEAAVTYQQVSQVWAIAAGRDYKLALEAC